MNIAHILCEISEKKIEKTEAGSVLKLTLRAHASNSASNGLIAAYVTIIDADQAQKFGNVGEKMVIGIYDKNGPEFSKAAGATVTAETLQG